MDINKVNIVFCDFNQSHFNDDYEHCIFPFIFVPIAKVFYMSDILINIDLMNDIDFLCVVLSHEIEHIILNEIFDYKTSIQYDNIYDFDV